MNAEAKSKLLCFGSGKEKSECQAGHRYYPKRLELTQEQEQAVIVEKSKVVSTWQCPECESIIIKIRSN